MNDINDLLEKANTGDAIAQINVGWMYLKGEGVPKDLVEAVKWYTKSAEQGHADAQYNLGLMYHNGDIVPKDEVLARKWFGKYTEQNP